MLSAALGGLLLGPLTPAAHGHGNNPKPDTSNTAPLEEHPGFIIPNKLIPGSWINEETPGNSEPGGGSGWGEPAGGPERLDGILRGVILDGTDQPEVIVDSTVGIGPDDILPPTPFEPTMAPGVLRAFPSGGAVPTPGTLALLGVAALALNRRRRR
ncbi:MAG: PEP-CTERM sorting domain-containing protein [Planctomycetota bacterium]